jgi:NAD(P)-dependent dehydrogenase (short-subunit alcohol dehydrogenase family)
MMEILNRVALVTGAADGVGRATAIALGRAGARPSSSS